MSWENEKEEPKVETEEKPVEVKEPEKEPAKEPEKEPEPQEKEPRMVPEALVGKVAKSIREKSRAEISLASERISQLEDENRRLREVVQPAEVDPKREEIAQEVQRAFLKRQDLYGRQKYGQAYDDALVVINAQADPILFRKIQGAVNPADTLMQEAAKIAEEAQHANDPGWKEREIENRVRKQVEAELLAKMKARGNQPTDVQGVRAAGGEVRAERKAVTWGTTLPR